MVCPLIESTINVNKMKFGKGKEDSFIRSEMANILDSASYFYRNHFFICSN